MNEVLRRRLIGLAILLLVAFGLTWLIPARPPAPAAPLPSTVVPVEGAPPPVSAEVSTGTPATVTAAAPVVTPPPAPPAVSPAQPAISDLSGASARTSLPPPPAKPAARPMPPAVSPPSVPRPKQSPTPPPAPTPKASPPAPAPASTEAAGQWWVQVGSYSDRNGAQTVLDLLEKVGYHGRITRVQARGAMLNRVRLGPYADEAAARRAQSQVARQGYPHARAVPAD